MFFLFRRKPSRKVNAPLVTPRFLFFPRLYSAGGHPSNNIKKGFGLKRYYYISDSLDDLVIVENELCSIGLEKPQFHVLSNNDAGVDTLHLHAVEAVLKSDVVYKTEIGFCVGIVAGISVLVFAHFSGSAQTYTWIPFIFFAIILLGFSTWEGGFVGIQQMHHDFARFKKTLNNGRHIFFVDVAKNQEQALIGVIRRHPEMEAAGEGSPTPKLVIDAQRFFTRFMQSAP